MTARVARGRKKKTTIEEELPPGTGIGEGEELSEFDVALESADDNETLKEVLEQFGQKDNVLYRIYKTTPTGQSFAYESPTFDEGFVQRERGAGAYVARIFINGRFKKSIPFQVEPPLNGNGSASTNGNGGGDSHSQFLEKLLMVLITNMTAGAGQNHGPSLTDMTSALANLDGLRGKQENTMDTFIKGVTLAKELMGDGGGGDWKSEILKTAREALPAITSIVSSRVTPSGTPPNTPETPATEEQPMDITKATPEQKRAMLLQVIQYLKQQCFQGLDPDTALNFICINAGAPQYQIIIQEVIALPFDELVKIDADLSKEPFNEFFRVIHDGLRSEFGGDDSVGDDPGRHSGDNENAGSNGDSGKAGGK